MLPRSAACLCLGNGLDMQPCCSISSSSIHLSDPRSTLHPYTALSATCVGVAARRRCCLALKLCPSFSSDFLWFWCFGRWETTTKLAAKLHLLRLAATTYMAARTTDRGSSIRTRPAPGSEFIRETRRANSVRSLSSTHI